MNFLVKRPDGIFRIALLKHKESESWSFVNLTKGHICPCKFQSIDEAIDDLNNYVKQGKIISYKQVKTIDNYNY